MNYLVTSFIAIARCVSDGRAICDEATTLADLLDGEFDDLDLEITRCCFEATHRVVLPDLDEDSLSVTIEDFVGGCVEPEDRTNPLFVTNRFLAFKRAIVDAIQAQSESDGPMEDE